MAGNYTEKNGIYPTIPTVPTVDADVRDPNDINKHLRLDFFNVIAEPDRSAYSCEVFHGASNAVYQYSKLFIYRFLTIFVGLPLMLFWGLSFGIYTFAMIWLAVPMRRLAQSAIAEAGIYIQTISDAVIAPIYRSFGLMWSNVRLTHFNHTIQSTKEINV